MESTPAPCQPAKPNVDKKKKRGRPKMKKLLFDEPANVATDLSKLTQYVSIDCEMVNCGKKLHLGRVSVVNEKGEIIMDKYVRPTEPVTNYHTAISGLTPRHLSIGEPLDDVSDELFAMLEGKHIMVGHSVNSDLRVMFPDRPPPIELKVRDLAECYALKQRVNKYHANGQLKTPSLKELAQEILHRDIQTGMHSSVEDARAAMEVFLLHKADVEFDVSARR